VRESLRAAVYSDSFGDHDTCLNVMPSSSTATDPALAGPACAACHWSRQDCFCAVDHFGASFGRSMMPSTRDAFRQYISRFAADAASSASRRPSVTSGDRPITSFSGL
jgi:hypothetical protein